MSTSRFPRRSFIASARPAFRPLPTRLQTFCTLHIPQPTSTPHYSYHSSSIHTIGFSGPNHCEHVTSKRQRTLPDPHDSAHDHTMKYFQQTVDFDYTWEEVSTSNWRKYGPWNEKTPHVIAVDTLSRSVDPATGIVSDSFFHMSIRRAPPASPSRKLTHRSSAPNVSSHASNPRPNGYKLYSAARTPPWSMRPPTSTPSPRSSPSAP